VVFEFRRVYKGAGGGCVYMHRQPSMKWVVALILASLAADTTSSPCVEGEYLDAGSRGCVACLAEDTNAAPQSGVCCRHARRSLRGLVVRSCPGSSGDEVSFAAPTPAEKLVMRVAVASLEYSSLRVRVCAMCMPLSFNYTGGRAAEPGVLGYSHSDFVSVIAAPPEPVAQYESVFEIEVAVNAHLGQSGYDTDPSVFSQFSASGERQRFVEVFFVSGDMLEVRSVVALAFDGSLVHSWDLGAGGDCLPCPLGQHRTPAGACAPCSLALRVRVEPHLGGGWLEPFQFSSSEYVPQWARRGGGHGVLTYNDYDAEGNLVFDPDGTAGSPLARHTLYACERTGNPLAAPPPRIWWTLPSSISLSTGVEECTNLLNTVVHHGVCVCGAGYISGSLNSSSGCGACPGNRVPDIAGDSCTCPAGHEANNSQTCAMCAPGSHKSFIGDTACTPCPEHTHASTRGARECVPNPSNSTSSDDRVDFVCDAGHRRQNAMCAACAPGTFQAHPGSLACVECPMGTFLAVTGASSVDDCLSCPAQTTTSTAGSVAALRCTCVPGAVLPPGAGVGDACELCPSGWFLPYTDAVVANVSCQPCPAGQFAHAGGAIACLLCGNNTYAPPPGGATACLDCPTGGSAARGSAACSCGGETCTECPAREVTTEPTGGQCVCITGHTREGGVCAPCPPGSAKGSSGDGACSACGNGTHAPNASASECTTNPSGFSTSQDGTRYVCAAGSFVAGATCEFCAPGGYQPHAGHTACLNCSAGTWLSAPGAASASSCIACGPGTFSAAVGARNASVCRPCPAGSYPRATPGASARDCAACPLHARGGLAGIAGPGECKCEPGFAGPRGGPVCTRCAPGATTMATAGASLCPPEAALPRPVRDDEPPPAIPDTPSGTPTSSEDGDDAAKSEVPIGVVAAGVVGVVVVVGVGVAVGVSGTAAGSAAVAVSSGVATTAAPALVVATGPAGAGGGSVGAVSAAGSYAHFYPPDMHVHYDGACEQYHSPRRYHYGCAEAW
jgi:hypothetical protein